jgi:ribonuclease HI
MLQPLGGGPGVTAADIETDADVSRLELLAAVRGLEALEQPSRVTLLTSSRYVRRGLRHDLGRWRENHWQWERFGQRVPIRDCDLWCRVDRALSFHDVECVGRPADQMEYQPTDPMECAATSLEAPRAAQPEFWNEPALLIVPGRQRNRLRPARHRRVSSGRNRGRWRQNVLETFAAFTHPALSRSA